MTINEESERQGNKKLLARRTIVKTAAWSVPAIALAVAVPAHAASGDIEIGAFQLNGTCGTLGLLGPGFTLTAGSAPIPVGTVVAINGSGIADIGVFSITGGTASVAVLSGTSRAITITSEIPAGATVAARTTLSLTVAFSLNAVLTLPDGYVGTGSKSAGSVNSTLILCTDN